MNPLDAKDVEHRAGAPRREDLPEGYLHIAVFGPGEGEAMVVRLPDGRAGVVDGCGHDGADKQNPVRKLLEELLVGDPRRLLFACLTHPHMDHFRGFDQVLDRWPPEHLWWSCTFERKSFKHYLRYLELREGASADAQPEQGTATELKRVIEAIHRRADEQGGDAGTRVRAQYLSDRKTLLMHAMEGRGKVSIEGLLPSTASLREAEANALKDVAALNASLLQGKKAPAGSQSKKAPAGTQSKKIPRTFDPNEISGALLLEWGQTRVLLGGDALEGDAGKPSGWSSLHAPLSQVQMVKIPHHASTKAVSRELWRQMQPQLGVVTCVKYAKGAQPPRPEILKELLEMRTHLFVTSKPEWWKAAQHDLKAEPAYEEKAEPPTTQAPGVESKATAPSNKDNAVVIRMNDQGRICKVLLFGEARRLMLG